MAATERSAWQTGQEFLLSCNDSFLFFYWENQLSNIFKSLRS